MSDEEFGEEFGEDLGKRRESEEAEEIVRVRLPRKGEVIGVVETLYGGCRMQVRCVDGLKRTCRIPGKFRKRLWIKSGDYVIVKLWDIEPDKGNIVFRYTQNQVKWLRNKGYLEKIDEEF